VIQTWVHVKSGPLKLIAVSSEQREPTFPNVPTVAETPDSKATAQVVAGHPRPGENCRPEIVNKLYNEVKRIVALPDFSEKLTALARARSKTPQEMGNWLATRRRSGEGGEGERL